MRGEVPGRRARAEFGELAFGTVDTWLIARLTGGRCHVTDPTNASRSLMFNIHATLWKARSSSPEPSSSGCGTGWV